MAFRLDNIPKQAKVSNEKEAEVSFLKKEITIFKKTFSNKIKEDFYTELSVLLKTGVSLKNALELLQGSQKKKHNQAVLQNITDSIVSGKSLSEALEQQKYFTEYEYYSLKIGEETGTLAKISEQLGDFFFRKNEQRRNLISAMTYPIIIMSTALLVVIFMLNFVVPMFQDIFEQQKIELPAITSFIISTSTFFQKSGWLIFCLILSLFPLKFTLSKKKWFKKIKDQLLLKLPFLGKFIKVVYLSQFAQAVALLTSAKVPVVNGIQLVKKMILFFPLQNALKDVEEDILSGVAFSDALAKHKLFDHKMIALVKVAEETNQMEFVFDRINVQYNVEVKQKSKLLSTIMEPFIILIVGVLVGVILIAMYLPMFKLSSVIG